MPGSFTQLLYHVVFSTKQRIPLLRPDIADRLYPFIGGVFRSRGASLLAAGGVEDHVHLYIRCKADVALADLVRDGKARSSKWIHATFPELRHFAWQEGYGAFTVSKSREGDVVEYIARQAEHHAKEDFQSEFLRLLRAHGVEFDERYVFD